MEKSNTEQLLAQDKACIWHPFTPQVGSMPPLLVEKAIGTRLYTSDGNEIIDAISSWWVSIHGHAHPAFVDTLQKQAANLEQVIFAGFTHEPAIKLASRLLALAPGNLSKVFFSDDGSTAIEVALKICLQYWYNSNEQRTRIIALEGAYHGDTFGAMAVGEDSPFSKPFRPLLFEVDFLSIPTCDNIFEPLSEADIACIAEFENLVGNNTAAFIYEPLVQGSSGMRFYKIALLDGLLEIAKRNNIPCIADEVMTGFSRTGRLFASEYMQHSPDIICLSKALSGGILPMGLTLVADYIYQAFVEKDLLKTFFHGHSFTANPLACACANTSLDLLLSENYCHLLGNIEKQHQSFIEELKLRKYPVSFRTLGVILALTFQTEQETSYVNEARHFLYQSFIERGVLLRPLGNVIYILPPYIIESFELQRIYNVIFEVLSEFYPSHSDKTLATFIPEID